MPTWPLTVLVLTGWVGRKSGERLADRDNRRTRRARHGGCVLGARLGSRANDRATEQRELAARREEWWRRFTWAAELAVDDTPVKRVAGLKLLAKLTQSRLGVAEETRAGPGSCDVEPGEQVGGAVEVS